MDYPRFRDVNIDRSFQKLKDHVFINYKGALIMRDKNPSTGKEGFYWKDEWFDDIELAHKKVDESIEILSRSLSVKMVVTKDGKDIPVGDEHIKLLFSGESAYESFKKTQQ